MRELLDETLSETNLPEREKNLLILAVDEAVSSLVQYGKFKGFDNDLSLSIDINDVRFRAIITDSANVFELGSSISESQVAKERQYTMGIFLIRKIMDEIHYVYRKGFQNDLEMIKFL